MELALQINSVFRVAGWQIVKPLEPLTPDRLLEDLAQYSKRAVVVDLGYYPENDAENGAFRIHAVRGEDWEHPLVDIKERDANMALDLLRQMPGLLGRLGPL